MEEGEHLDCTLTIFSVAAVVLSDAVAVELVVADVVPVVADI